MMVNAIHIPVSMDDPLEIVRVDTEFGAPHSLQDFIGGYIEIVHTQLTHDRGHVMVVDEESLLKKDPQLNPRASYLYGTHRHGSPIAGTALIVGEAEVMQPEGYPEMDFVDMPDAPAQLSYYNALFSEVFG